MGGISTDLIYKVSVERARSTQHGCRYMRNRLAIGGRYCNVKKRHARRAKGTADCEVGIAFNLTRFRSDQSTSIRMDQSWLQMMFPHIANPEDTQPGLFTSTTLEVLVNKAFKRDDILLFSSDPVATWNTPVFSGRNRTLTLEALIAAAFADGLSRYGLEKVLKPSLSPETARRWQITDFTKNEDYNQRLLDDDTRFVEPQPTASNVTMTKFHTSILISGYAFQMQSATDYLAAVIFGLHILLATCHITYTIYAGTSPRLAIQWCSSSCSRTVHFHLVTRRQRIHRRASTRERRIEL